MPSKLSHPMQVIAMLRLFLRGILTWAKKAMRTHDWAASRRPMPLKSQRCLYSNYCIVRYVRQQTSGQALRPASTVLIALGFEQEFRRGLPERDTSRFSALVLGGHARRFASSETCRVLVNT